MAPLPFALLSALLLLSGLAFATWRPWSIVYRPWSVLAVVGVITLGALALLVRLDPPGLSIQLDASSEPLLPVSDPGQDVYREAVLDFGSDDVYVVAMETDDVFTRSHLERLRRISDRIRQLPGVRDAESLVEVAAFRYVPEDDWIEVGRFIEELPDDDAALGDLRRRALADPIYTKALVSRDGRTAALNVRFQTMDDAEFVERDLDGSIAAILQAESGDGARFFVSGRPHIRSEAHHLMVRDLVLLIPIAVLIASVLLWLLTGSVRGTLVPLVNCLVATLWAFGAMAALGRDLNIITLVLGPMLICVGSVYGIHVLARYEQIAAGAPHARAAAMATLEYTRLPVLMAGFTTIVGFGALLLADVSATRELGSFAMFGVASVMLLSLTGVPAVLALLPLEARAAESAAPVWAGRTGLATRVGAGIDRLLGGLGRLCIRWPGPVLLGWALAAVLAVALIPRIVIDTDYLTVFDPDTRVRTDFAAVNRLLAGAIPIYVTFDGKSEGRMRDPDTLRALERVQARLEQVPGVSQVLSAVDLVRVVNRALHGGRPEEERVPDTREALAEALFAIPKEDLRRFATSNHSGANLIVRTGSLGSAAIRELERRILEVLETSELSADLRYNVTGNAILINKSADGIARNQLTQVGSAALTILLLVWLGFRSLRVALLALVPNVLPVLLFFGALGAGAATLSLATSLIGCIALGIAVDDTVHFLATFHRQRNAGDSTAEAVQHCMETVGRAIVLTTIMLVIGFLVLFFSGFATLREFGYLTALTMTICLSTDLGLLPALLVRARA